MKLVQMSLIIFAVFISFSQSVFAANDTASLRAEKGILDNLHEIDSGKMFRSAQLSPETLEKLILSKKIKTVINLRGENPGDAWYDDETAIIKKYNLTQVNISMDADRLPLRDDLLVLLQAFKTAPRPLLIHCLRGVDRTGEASAIYQMLYQGKTKLEALNMLSVKYSYVQTFKPAKYYFIDQVWQNEQWAYDAYKPCDSDYKYFDKIKYCR